MTEDNKEKSNEQKSWIKEHDSIQVDLLKMKDELLTGQSPEKEIKAETAQQSRTSKEDVPKRDGDKVARKEGDPSFVAGELTIKQMLAGNGKAPKKEVKETRSAEAPKLAEGHIPVSPDLTDKIANVLVLESKLKRRSFELEKEAREDDTTSTPIKPHVQRRAATLRTEGKTVDEVPEKNEPRKDLIMEGHKKEMTPKETKVTGPSAKKGTTVPRTPEVEGKKPGASRSKSNAQDHKEIRKKKKGIWALFGR
ncbi:MAG: hypothetical protein JXA22_00985 [Candidatus Thermoplasmatota archaeon]|nr:hypothetical protein [Candidatus Thermoplasmatota archaeon]